MALKNKTQILSIFPRLIWFCFLVAIFILSFSYENSPVYYLPLFSTTFFTGSQDQLTDENANKTFAYLTMTEECIPDYFLEDVALGNAANLDVYVLSYQKVCNNSNTPKHVTYIFKPGTTWTTGRNALFYHVQSTQKKYHYQIYMDDDIYLYFSEYLVEFAAKEKLLMQSRPLIDRFTITKSHIKASREIRYNMSSWRYFEKTLLDYSPAFAVPNLSDTESRLLQEQRWDRVCGSSRKMPWVTPTFFVDTNFVAYHHEALPLLMPFCTLGDDISWFLSAVYLIQRLKSLLYRQCIGIWKISVLGQKNRPYPRTPFPDHYLDIYWNTPDGKKIKNLIDIRERDFVMFYRDNGKWKDVYLGDRGMCTDPVRFPVAQYYQVTHT